MRERRDEVVDVGTGEAGSTVYGAIGAGAASSMWRSISSSTSSGSFLPSPREDLDAVVRPGVVRGRNDDSRVRTQVPEASHATAGVGTTPAKRTMPPRLRESARRAPGRFPRTTRACRNPTTTGRGSDGPSEDGQGRADARDRRSVQGRRSPPIPRMRPCRTACASGSDVTCSEAPRPPESREEAQRLADVVDAHENGPRARRFHAQRATARERLGQAVRRRVIPRRSRGTPCATRRRRGGRRAVRAGPARRDRAKFCAGVLPNPRPGSRMMFSARIPEETARVLPHFSQVGGHLGDDIGEGRFFEGGRGSAAAVVDDKGCAQGVQPARTASLPEMSRPVTTLTMSAPTSSAAAPPRHGACRSRGGRTGISSKVREDGKHAALLFAEEISPAPSPYALPLGRVLSPPMSRIVAPSFATQPSSPAASADAKRPPSLKESGVTFRIAMTPGGARERACGPWGAEDGKSPTSQARARSTGRTAAMRATS